MILIQSKYQNNLVNYSNIISFNQINIFKIKGQKQESFNINLLKFHFFTLKLKKPFNNIFKLITFSSQHLFITRMDWTLLFSRNNV